MSAVLSPPASDGRGAAWLERLRSGLQLGAREVTIGFVAALLLLLAVAVMSYRGLDDFITASARVEHTRLVIDDLQEVLSQLKDAETGQRGFLITGDESFLVPYNNSLERIPDLVDSVVARTADNTTQSARLMSLDDQVDRRLKALELGIGLKRSGAPVQDIRASMDEGKTLMDGIRATIAAVISNEEVVLAQRAEEVKANAMGAKQAIVLGNAAALLLLGLAFVLLRGEVARRRQAQLTAQASAEEAADLYNRAPCAYHSVGSDGLLTRVNDTWLALFGYERDEVVGRMRHQDVMTPDSAERLVAAQRDPDSAFKRQGYLQDTEFDYVRKDDTVFTAAINASVVRLPGSVEITGRTALFDVTERKRAEAGERKLTEELKRRSAQLEATNRELESFSYSVSHDLRAPLRAIDGFSRMLEEDYQDRFDDEGRRMLGVVRSNAAQMAQLIDDLLAFSRLGQQKVAATPVDMNVLVQEAVAELFPGEDAAARGITVEPLPQGYGDRTLLRQVWINLISNGVKYSARSKPPRVRISGRVNETAAAAASEYSVEDNGVGFDMKYYDKLFGVFQRLHSAGEFPGTGVGLAIVQRVVTRHGGSVGAEGRLDEGARFFFSLPAAAEAAHG